MHVMCFVAINDIDLPLIKISVFVVCNIIAAETNCSVRNKHAKRS